MVKPRILETDQGITGDFNTHNYDLMMRWMRDKGWIETNLILKSGISSGMALEIGPGPGYLGLEWLKKTQGTRLKSLEISSDMITLAKKTLSNMVFLPGSIIMREMLNECLFQITILRPYLLMVPCMNGHIL